MKKKRLQMIVPVAVILFLAGCGSKQQFEYRSQGIEKMAGQEYEAAISLFDQALESSKGFSGDFELDVLKYRAEAEYELKDYAAAINTYDILIEVDQERADYLIQRALALTNSGQLEQALDDYTKAYVISPKAVNLKTALLRLGDALLLSGEPEKTVILYQQAIADGIADSEIYNQMGVCQLQMEHYEEAIQYFDQGILLAEEADLAKLEFNLASVYTHQQNYEKALELFQNYEKKYGQNSAVSKEIAFLKTR